MTEPQRHRVAITVFMEAPGADALDASYVAALAVRQAFGSRNLKCHLRDQVVPVTVAHVAETGAAAANGYLWTQPTAKAYREFPPAEHQPQARGEAET